MKETAEPKELKKKSERVVFYDKRKMITRLKAKAEADETSMSRLLRRLIRKGLRAVA